MIYDCIVLGAGPAGIFATISAAKEGKKVLLLEKMPQIALKLKATGGGKCNLTNTLSPLEFIEKFGKNGRFIKDALNELSRHELLSFFASIGVETIARDGFRIFPINHSSSIIIDSLLNELKRLEVSVKTSVNIENIERMEDKFVLSSKYEVFRSFNLVLATGG